MFHSECISLEGRAAGSTINGEEQHNQSEIGLSVCWLYKTTNSRAGGWGVGCATFSHVTGRSLSTPTECSGADFRLWDDWGTLTGGNTGALINKEVRSREAEEEIGIKTQYESNQRAETILNNWWHYSDAACSKVKASVFILLETDFQVFTIFWHFTAEKDERPERKRVLLSLWIASDCLDQQ